MMAFGLMKFFIWLYYVLFCRNRPLSIPAYLGITFLQILLKIFAKMFYPDTPKNHLSILLKYRSTILLDFLCWH